MTAVEIIRIVGVEFKEVQNFVLAEFIQICRPMVSRKQFGSLYEQALAYLVCHKMKMAGYGASSVVDGLSVADTFGGVSSVSEGGSSISFGTSQAGNLTPDAELGLTVYGVQFLQLRRSAIVPIHINGEGQSRSEPYDDVEYVIPAASNKQLGGVKVRPGSGLKLHKDGTLEIDDATKPQVEDLIDGDTPIPPKPGPGPGPRPEPRPDPDHHHHHHHRPPVDRLIEDDAGLKVSDRNKIEVDTASKEQVLDLLDGDDD